MFEKIVVGVNQTESANKAAEAAAELAERLEAELHLVCAFAPGSGGGDPLSSMVPGAAVASGPHLSKAPGGGEARVRAENFLTGLARSTPVRTRTHALPGDPAEMILQVCGEIGADLVVVGNKGMKGARRVLGSVPNTISHQAPCAVLIVHTV